MLLLTTEARPMSSAQVSTAADVLGLNLFRTGSPNWRRTQIEIGSVHVPAFSEPEWRDLGEGPSWQEKYTLDHDLPRVPIMWDPFSTHSQVSITFPVTSLLRQGGVKWGGVSLAANDDDTARDSQHMRSTYDYAAFKELAGGTLFGYVARLHRGVGFREIPYAHDASKTHFVLDLEG